MNMNKPFANLFRMIQFTNKFSTKKVTTTSSTNASSVAEHIPLKYNPWQAIRLLKSFAHITYDETVDVCIHLNVNPKIGDHIVRGTAVMPAGTGKKIVVAVLCPPDLVQQIKQSGADLVDQRTIIEQIKNNKIVFDKLYCTPDLLSQLKPYAKTLGPRGLMPNAKVGNLVIKQKLQQAVKQAKQGQVTFRVDSGKNIHAPIGKISFSDEQLIENLRSLMRTLSAKKPATAKGKYMKKSFMKTTVGPIFQIDIEGIDPKSKHYLLDVKQ